MPGAPEEASVVASEPQVNEEVVVAVGEAEGVVQGAALPADFRKYCLQFRKDLDLIRHAHVYASETFRGRFYLYAFFQLLLSAAITAMQGLDISIAVVIVTSSLSSFVQAIDKVFGLQAGAEGHTMAAMLYRGVISKFDHHILHKIVETDWDAEDAADALAELRAEFQSVMAEIDELARTVPILPEKYRVNTQPFVPLDDDTEVSEWGTGLPVLSV